MISTIAAAIVTITVAVLGWYWVYRKGSRHQQSNNKEASSRHCHHVTELNDFEQLFITIGLSPTTTVTWLELEPNNKPSRSDMNDNDDGSAVYGSIQTVLKARVKAILQANPWLCGRFVKQPSNGKYAMEYSTREDAISQADVDRILCFVSPSESPIRLGTPIHQIYAHLILGTQKNLVLELDKELHQPFWKIALIPDCHNPHKRVALVVSLSHIVGDGHTFYDLHNMILEGDTTSSTRIRTLHVTRIPNTTQLAKDAMGNAESLLFTGGNLGFLCSVLKGVILSKVIGRFLLRTKYKSTSRCFLLDPLKIQAIKEEYQKTRTHNAATIEDENDQNNHHSSSPTSSFISTNDIIASWFLSHCHHENGLMAINLRDRLEGHTKHHAGNYENALYYRLPRDAQTPDLIRQSVSCLQRVVTANQPVRARNIALESLALSTNWTTFISHDKEMVNIQGYKKTPLVHLPAYNMGEALPATFSICLIFQAKPNQIAVLLGGTEENLKAFSKAPFEADQPFSSILSSQ